MAPAAISVVDRALGPLRRATKELKLVPNSKDLAIVVYSSESNVPTEISDAALSEGARSVLVPPFHPTSLLAKLNAALDLAFEPEPEPEPTTAPLLLAVPADPPASPRPNGDWYSRRRSVDVGGLALALGEEGRGKGWGGWDESDEGEIGYAELLSDMYTQTHSTIDIIPPSFPSKARTLSFAGRRRLVESLSTWNFEPHKLPEDEVLACAELLFEAVLRIEGMEADVGLSLDQLSPFLQHLRQIYRIQNKYHNFTHALDVFQAIYTFLQRAGIFPPLSILQNSADQWKPAPRPGALTAVLRNRDLFALCLAAVGHDVGHPGLSNAFMKNAQTPLSRVYDDKSALERMHCTLLAHLMRKHKLEHLINSSPGGHEFRKLLIGTVLATDMSVHFEWLQRFEKYVRREVPVSDNEARLLLCQALIKCGDISNPARPHPVSEHWSSALLEEWASQASLEMHLALPVSVAASPDDANQAKGQIGFINAFVQPLFDVVVSAIPEFSIFAKCCALNRKLWNDRLEKLESAPQSPFGSPTSSPRRFSLPPLAQYLQTVFPLSLPPASLIPSSLALPSWSPPRPPPVARPAFDSRPSTAQSQPSSSSSTPGTSFSSFSVYSYSNTSPSFSPRSTKDSGLSAAGLPPDAQTALRSAFRASVRKKKSFHRSSWDVPSSRPAAESA